MTGDDAVRYRRLASRLTEVQAPAKVTGSRIRTPPGDGEQIFQTVALVTFIGNASAAGGGGLGWCQHVGVMTTHGGHLRIATADDGLKLLGLWAKLFNEDDSATNEPWKIHASEWFARFVDDTSTARFTVIEVGADIVATAIGTLELGVPNPYCLKGRTVRLANVITVPEYRGRGYGTSLVLDVIDWAKLIDADRVDLSATPAGQRIYENAGFAMTTAPRMKLVL